MPGKWAYRIYLYTVLLYCRGTVRIRIFDIALSKLFRIFAIFGELMTHRLSRFVIESYKIMLNLTIRLNLTRNAAFNSKVAWSTTFSLVQGSIAWPLQAS